MAGEVWTYGEQREGRLDRLAFELLTRGRSLADKLGTKLASIVIGSNIDRDGIRELFERGADKVYLVEKDELAYYINDRYTNVICHLITTYKPMHGDGFAQFADERIVQGGSVHGCLQKRRVASVSAAWSNRRNPCRGIETQPGRDRSSYSSS